MPNYRLRAWLHAGRPRTLPLALSGIILGSLLAASVGHFYWEISILGVLTALFLQIFSNLANDYGDSVHGADHVERKGPMRAVQSGAISGRAMRQGMVVCGLAALSSGLLLIFYSFSLQESTSILLFFVLGICALAAALKYTYGKNPYGYAGFGDLFVWIFFGPAAVLGMYYLHTHRWDIDILLPACSVGIFSVAVLNVNNIRDIDSDRTAGKRSIPVRIGAQRAKVYHIALLLIGWGTAFIYFLKYFSGPVSFLYFLSMPLFAETGIGIVKQNSPEKIDPYLKKTAVATLLFAVTFGLSIAL